MVVDIKSVEKTAKLAKLKFEPIELASITNKIDVILKMISNLNEVDTSNVLPLYSISDSSQKMRSDIVSSHDVSDHLFDNLNNNAVAKELKCFIVPKVIE